MREVPRLHGRGEPVHLAARVVVVVLALHVPAGMREQTGDGITEHRVPCMADVQRAGRVGADELHLDALAVGLPGAVGRARRHHVAERVVQPAVGDEDVQEPRAGNLDALDERRLREGGADRLGHLARVPSGSRGQHERDVGREVAVLLLLGGQQLRFRPFSLDPEFARRRLERRPDQLEEALLDHDRCRSATRRRMSSTRSPGSNGLLTKSTGPSPPCAAWSSSGERAVRKTTGTSARLGDQPHLPAHLVATQPREHHVEDDRARGNRAGPLERHVTARDRRHPESHQTEVDLEQPRDHRVVVDQEDHGDVLFRHALFRHAPRIAERRRRSRQRLRTRRNEARC